MSGQDKSVPAQNHSAFIRKETRLQRLALLPQINLYQASEVVPLWQASEAHLAQIGLPPPFWAFAWPGGQALAGYILDNPQLVAGKRVLDFASGSGLVAIAAAMAGAALVQANDIDAFALAAIKLNAEANGVKVEPMAGDIIGAQGGWDVVLAGDISYEKETAQRMTQWLAELAENGRLVLLGDPGRSYLARDRLLALASYDVPVSRDIEDCDIKTTSVFSFLADHLTS